MSAASGANAISEAYKAAGASASQVAAIQAAEKSYQTSGGGGVATPTTTKKMSYADQLAQGGVVNMQDYLASIGQSKANYDPSTNMVTLGGNTYKPGTIPGTYFDKGTNTHYVTNKTSFDGIAGISGSNSGESAIALGQQQPKQLQQTAQVPQQGITALPTEVSVDTEAKIKELAAAQRQSRIAGLEKAKAKALGELDTYKTSQQNTLDTTRGNNMTAFKNSLASSNAAYDTEGAAIEPAYYNKRNQAAGASEVGAMNFANYMAARGIRGEAGAMPEIYRNASLQGKIGAYDLAEAQDQADLAARRTATETAFNNNMANLDTAYNADVAFLGTDYDTRKLGITSAYDSDVTQANADVDAASLQAYIDSLKTAQATALQMGQLKLQNMQQQQKVTQDTKDAYNKTIGQFSNDYAAEINNVQNDGDSSNDWQIAMLQAARNKKLQEQEEAAAKAAQQDFENSLALQKANKSSGGGSSGGIPDNPFPEPDTSKINGYDVTRIDNYISGIRNQHKTADATYTAIQNATGLNADFKAAILTRLDALQGVR